jgi:carbonic anhydrase
VPQARRAVEAGQLTPHGWYYMIENEDIHVFDAEQGALVRASVA